MQDHFLVHDALIVLQEGIITIHEIFSRHASVFNER